jgi:hypothetical protein
MKPVAPELPSDDAKVDQPTLQSEIRRLCDAKASEDRITIPAPPSEEALRASTPHPPRGLEPASDTVPAPPPSAQRKRHDGEREDASSDAVTPSTIPGPPPLPRIAGV